MGRFTLDGTIWIPPLRYLQNIQVANRKDDGVNPGSE